MIRSTFTINLTQGKQVLVDERDWYKLRKQKWHAHKERSGYYAMRCAEGVRQNGKRHRIHIAMHRLIVGLTNEAQEVDHINRNTLDNRRSNLRIVDTRGNRENRVDQSTYGPGVRLNRTETGFEAFTKVDGVLYHLGTYPTAARAQEVRRAFLASL